ncbi:MAG: prepilin peptidase [Minwuiales bacterium]|nr:prepilin peptidase [Minwuiales bacterium]
MTSPFVVYFAILIGFTVLLLTAAAIDIKHFVIPNRLSLAIALLYPAHFLTSPTPIELLPALGIAAGMLAFGFALFAGRLLGGGDAKLMSATALWAGSEHFLPFFLMTTLSGGALALTMWVKKRSSLASATGPDFVPEADTANAPGAQPMPYGVAIAIGGVHVALSKLLGA